jgi:CO dehydrogenase/acetyl-CoA synthase beta subunit
VTATARDQEEQDLRLELMTAQLDQIRFEMEQARRDFETGQQRSAQIAREDRRRFYIQMIVTSIAGLTAAVALILHLLGRV